MEETKKKSPKGEVVVKLDYPIEWGEDTIEEVRLRRPKGKHIKNLGDDVKVNDFLRIASKVSGLSMGIFEEMEAPDVMKITDAVGELL